MVSAGSIRKRTEWLESLDELLDPSRAYAGALPDVAVAGTAPANSGWPIPALTSTDYMNSIATEIEPWFPGDEDVERRYRAWIRWNASDHGAPGAAPRNRCGRAYFHLRVVGGAL